MKNYANFKNIFCHSPKEIRGVKSTPVHTARNVINRNFGASMPNEKWFITHITYGNGQGAYLSAIIDRYNRTIIAQKIITKMDNQLVKDTIDLVFKSNLVVRPIIHSDRFSQYTSVQYRDLKEEYKFKISMLRPGKCLDNQPIEVFFWTLKVEYYYRYKFKTLLELEQGIEKYLDFYMNRRYVSKFNGLTPAEFGVAT